MYQGFLSTYRFARTNTTICSFVTRKKALESCPGAETLEQVMEWLIAHEDDLDDDKTSKSSDGNVNTEPTKVDQSDKNQKNGPGEVNESAANMAARKKITVEEAQRFITERQAKRAEEERKKEIEDEKKRRLDGQKMAQTRAELKDQEMVHLAQQIRREKIEKELHRKRVLEQIARDREAMKARNNFSTAATNPTSSATSRPSAESSTRGPATECKLALRFPDGSSLMQKFSPSEQLSAVRAFVQTSKGVASIVEFVAPPNKKLSDNEMNNTLESLGLCPASRLEVKYKQNEWVDLD